MGSLSLPDSGTGYIDAVAIIYSLPPHPTYWPILLPFWEAARERRFEVVSSDLTLMEVLGGPIRTGDTSLGAAYEEMLSSDVRLLPILQPVLRNAAVLRLHSGLKTPDAIHAATALAARCTLFLTNDPHFRRVSGLPVAVLDDLLAG
jgi:predicted nucleic acid-binding protein